MNEKLIGCPALEALGLHTRGILVTTAQRHRGVFKVPENACIVTRLFRVARIYSGGSHSNHGQEPNQEDTPDTWLVWAEEADEEWECKL